MSKLGLVIGREYSSRVKKKSFIILTILVPLIMGALGALALWFGMEEEKHLRVLVDDPADLCGGKIFIGQDENPPATFYFTDHVEDDDFRYSEVYKDYDVKVNIDPDVFTNRTILGYFREQPKASTNLYIQKKITGRLQEYFAEDEGVSAAKFREILKPYEFTLLDVDDDKDKEGEMKAQMVGIGFSVMIFVFLIVYAGQVMRSVLEEKTSRVVEIIVSSVKPFELMLGKIVAIGLVGLTQFAIWIILLSVIMMSIQGMFTAQLDAETVQNIAAGAMDPEMMEMMNNDNAMLIYQQINWGTLIVMFLIYFLLGYVLYASLFAIVGAASDSETDTQQLMIPVMLPLMFVYFISFSIIGNVDGLAALWGSYIPFSSPIIMLQRVATGTVDIYEVIISVLLLIGTCLLTVYLAGKVYRTGILMYGKKASWKEIIKWLRH